MKARRLLWVLAVLLLVGVVAVLVPGSPIYLPNVMTSGPQHDGRSASSWIRALDSPDPKTRIEAIKALGAIGPAAEEAVPKLAKIMLEDPERVPRIEATLALSKMTPASKAVVPQLAQAVEDPEPFVRVNAVIALFRLKGDARPAVPALLRAMERDDNDTNLAAFTFTIHEMTAMALGRASAGTDEGVPALLAALDAAKTPEGRRAVARALGDIGPPARDALPKLKPLLKDRDQTVRETAEAAIKNIEGEPGAAAPAGEGREVAAAPADPELPEDERAYLWEVEHHGNVLAKHGFGPFAAALKAGDAPALSRLLADDFAAADLREPQQVRAVTAFAEVERLQDAGRPPAPLTREGFVARLMQFRKLFGRTPQVKLALMTLGPRPRRDLDGTWEGTAQLRLHGEHTVGAPAEVVVLLRYEVPRPTEAALARPGWLRSAAVLQVLTGKAPYPLFAEVARERGLATSRLHDNWKAAKFVPTPGGVYVCDYDRDGLLDLLVTDVNAGSLYRGRPGGRFEDVTERSGLPRPALTSPAVAWADLDGDGWEDLLLGSAIFRNAEGRRFEYLGSRSNFRLPLGGSNVVVADYDRDGKLDLYVTRTGQPGDGSWLAGRTADPKGNYLFRNLGGWQFEDVTRSSGTLGGHRSTFTAAWLDANDDGWPDLHVPNEFGDGALLVNQGDGTFAERALADRPADFGTMGLAVGDVNNDGRIDIYCNNMYSKAGTRVIGNLAPGAYPPEVMEKFRCFVAGSQLHLNRGGLKFEQAGKAMQVAAVGWSYGASLADLDNDGWLDVYANAGYVSRSRDEPDG
jgi:HEAT repeat protein